MHSEQESFRATLRACDPDGQLHTLIITRQGRGSRGRVWLTLHGAWKTTAVLTDPEATQLTELLTQAQRPAAPPQP